MPGEVNSGKIDLHCESFRFIRNDVMKRTIKNSLKLNLCSGLKIVILSLWVSASLAVDKGSGVDTSADIINMLFTALLIANYGTTDQPGCRVRVLPGDTDDLALKAALFPACTLLVSGNYQVRSTISLYANRILGAGDNHSVRLLPKAQDHDLMDCPNGTMTGLSSETTIAVTAVFSPAEGFSGNAFFQPHGNTSFQNIGIQTASSELLPPVHLIAPPDQAGTVPIFTNIGLASSIHRFSEAMPVVEEWGKGRHQKQYSERRSEYRKGEYSKGREQRDQKQSGHPSKKGPYTAGDREPPKRPSRDEKPPAVNEADPIVIMILTLVSEILSGQNTQKNIQSIRDLLKNASPKTIQELLEDRGFCRLNRLHDFVATCPRQTARK